MGYPLRLALRYLGSKKRASISVGTAFAILGVALGVAALLTVMSVTAGFQAEFRDKVLGVNAHVLVMRPEFTDYRDIMERVRKVKGVRNVAPFSINPMMLSSGDRVATGVLVKGVDPRASLGVGLPEGVPPVLDLPKQVVRGDAGECPKPSTTECGIRNLAGLRRPDAAPTPGPTGTTPNPPRLDFPPEMGGSPAPKLQNSGANLVPSGVPDDDPNVLDGLVDDPCADPEKVKNLPGIVVGISLAETLGLDLGSCVTISSPTIGYQFAGGTMKPPVAKKFRVMAIFEAGFEQYDSKLVYTDLYEAQPFYDGSDTVTGVEMKIDDIDRSDDVVRDVRDALPGCSSGPCAYNIMDWKELNHGLFTALLIQQIGMSGVLALIILVAAFTVVATLIMVVLDKKKEISVLKAMGATDSAILRIFLYQGGLIGGVGTSLGLLIGFAVCKGLLVWAFPLDPKVYFISQLPVVMRWQEFAVTGGVALALCLLATIIPSTYAARIRPADGFREM